MSKIETLLCFTADRLMFTPEDAIALIKRAQNRDGTVLNMLRDFIVESEKKPRILFSLDRQEGKALLLELVK